MKLGFPSYETTFPCDCTLREATERIAKAVAREANDFKLKSAGHHAGTQKIVIDSKLYSMLRRNSFAPVITLEIREAEQGSSAHVTFALRKSVKTFLLVYCSIAILFGATLATVFLISRRAFAWPLCIPFGLAAFAYVLSRIGLRGSVSGKLKILQDTLTGDARHLPPVRRC